MGNQSDSLAVPDLHTAQAHAQAGRFPEMLALCQQAINAHGDNVIALLDVGALLFNFGFFSHARNCFEWARNLAPDDPRPAINLANLAREAGRHDLSREFYASLQERFPASPMIRRNALVSLEYDPGISDIDCVRQAQEWGEWAVRQAGGRRSRPALCVLAARPLRIGYVSADLCQHTVGLFVKNVLKAHDPARVIVFAYSAGSVNDWVTDDIRACTQYRDVGNLDDSALANLIRQDEIDILIDLSGHTAGSRLTMFAQRPAPVQISWLGYFATTGLASCMDAVLLDEWHAPPGTEALFVEPIIRLPGGRFCYTPVPWAPAGGTLPPYFENGHITFGCFNNTAKFNEGVFDLWARILADVSESRLVLKWRTFHDAPFCQAIREAFTLRGIAAERIDLRSPSFHVDLLKQYADIDIALDPFPFTGGMTSCEALWMGVPVITWPQRRVVSRQTFAFLSAIGLQEFAAKDADDYVRIAVHLAHDPARVKALRATLRERMLASSLCDVAGFTHGLEDALRALFEEVTRASAPREVNFQKNST